MKTLKIFLLVAVFTVLWSPLTVSAQDAEYNLIRRQYTVNSDGSIDMRYRKELKLIRNRAITAYADKGETFILYNPAYDQLTINESYTLLPDGSKVQTPSNAFIDQLPTQCQDCGRYNGLRERVVVHTALEYNCVVVLDYTIHHTGTSGWTEVVNLAQDCPVKLYELTVNVKDNSNWSVTPLDGSHKTLCISNSKKCRLVSPNIEQTVIENYSAAKYPRVIVNLRSDKTGSAADNNERLPEAEMVLSELFDHDSLQWAVNIRDYVVDNIKTIDIKPSMIDNRLSSAATTFKSGCGNPEEKTILLAAMLRQAGFRVNVTNLSEYIDMTVNGDNGSLDYRLSSASKRQPRLQGLAIDEQRTIEIERELLWNSKAIGGGYSQMVIPTEEGSINIDPAWLTSTRKSTLRVRNCNERYHYTVVPPRTPKRILVKPVDIKYSKKGIGSIRISIKQLDDGAIDIVRELNIDVYNGIVTTKQYKDFRKMMQDWNTYRTFTVRVSRGL